MNQNRSTFLPLRISLLTFSCFCLGSAVQAQVTPDNTLNTQVTQADNVAEITGGETRGNNLFHSFQDFSVTTGSEAFFNNDVDLANIFSRVTGGNLSNIDGLIRANGSASLFLINPAGIVFGENARLDVGGSFYGSTADRILFEDGGFSAVEDLDSPVLSINAPIGLNLRESPSPIINRSVAADAAGNLSGLAVTTGGTLSLVGGDIDFAGGKAIASGGSIEIGGLRNTGVVTIETDGSLTFPENVSRANLTFGDATDIDVRGAGGGNIALYGNDVTLIDGSLLQAGITEESSFSDAQAGDISIEATGNIVLDANSLILNQVDPEATGNAGNINLLAASLSLAEDSAINASSFGRGNAGTINITTVGDLNVEGDSGIFATLGIDEDEEEDAEDNTDLDDELDDRDLIGEGNGGTIDITATNLTLTNGGRVDASVFGEGDGGNINLQIAEQIAIDGEDSAVSSSVGEDGVGNSGDLNLVTRSLIVTNEGEISNSIEGTGNAGGINIDASEVSLINGEISTEVDEDAVGNAGSIILDAAQLSIADQAELNSSTSGQGDAGSIAINVDRLSLIDGEISTSAESEAVGNGGNINLVALDSVSISATDPENFASGLFANTEMGVTGEAGNVSVTTKTLDITDNGIITVSSQGMGDGGQIALQAEVVNLNNSAAIAATTAFGQGGEILLDVDRNLTLDNNSRISAEAFNRADGGNIAIDTRFLIGFPNGSNNIIASSERGIGGNINIATETIFGFEFGAANPDNPQDSTNRIDASSAIFGNLSLASDNLLDLDSINKIATVDSEQTLAQACQAGRESAKNGLSVVGKGGIPPEPGLPLNSLNTTIDGKTNSASAIMQPIETSIGKIQPARGVKVTESGEIILTAYPTNNSGDRSFEGSRNCGRV
ncbi:MAG: filamentous hemagglutinin N-terminal domain-containing protein [Cyanobacteria bacterium J06600_6]